MKRQGERMVSRVQRRMMVHRKLKQQLHSLTRFKSIRDMSIPVDAINFINELKLKLETMIQDYKIMLNKVPLPTEVKAEEIGDGLIKIKVTSKKGRDVLVSVLESFEEMGLNVLHARVSCTTPWFCMEATAETRDDNALDVTNVTHVILKAIGEEQPGEEKKNIHNLGQVM